jgi:hypothetical protein
MYLQKRSNINFERNRLIAIFLRKLKYFNRILFLTTNLASQFNKAIFNRIHFIMKYENLNKNIRRIISIYFLKKTKIDRRSSNFNNEDLDCLTETNLNDR